MLEKSNYFCIIYLKSCNFWYFIAALFFTDFRKIIHRKQNLMCIDYWSCLAQSMKEGLKYKTYKRVQLTALAVQKINKSAESYGI